MVPRYGFGVDMKFKIGDKLKYTDEFINNYNIPTEAHSIATIENIIGNIMYFIEGGYDLIDSDNYELVKSYKKKLEFKKDLAKVLTEDTDK